MDSAPSVRRADPRFLLPRPVQRVRLLGGLEGWPAALAQAGVEIVETGSGDAVVAPAALVREAAALGAPAMLIEGSHPPCPGYVSQRVAALPSIDRPELLVPLRGPAAARSALRRWAVPPQRWKRERNRAVSMLLGRGIAPPGVATLTVSGRESATPYLVEAAEAHGVPAGAGWFATFGGEDLLSRGIFHLFAPAASEPGWVVKFARVSAWSEPFERDEHGLAIARTAPALVSEKAPVLLGRFAVDGVHASLETAAVGVRLSSLLRSRRPRAEKLAAIEQVAAWVVEVGAATRGPAARLAPERRRLAGEVVPSWPAARAALELLPEVPSVLRHGDLWSENVIVGRAGFCVVDWEQAHAHGFPLWDMLFFLTESLALLDRAEDGDERPGHFRRLWRGELASSETAFRWVRLAGAAAGVPAEAVGALATLLWAAVAREHRRQAEHAAQAVVGAEPAEVLLDALAEAWLSDEALGPGWRAY